VNGEPKMCTLNHPFVCFFLYHTRIIEGAYLTLIVSVKMPKTGCSGEADIGEVRSGIFLIQLKYWDLLFPQGDPSLCESTWKGKECDGKPVERPWMAPWSGIQGD
jgi:hypothetical protein